MKDQLLIGCGNVRVNQQSGTGFDRLVTLDIDPNVGADVEWDLENLPLPFEDESFDEIHAYEILEHTGRQGDFRFFFTQFSDFWRILRPEGRLIGSVPRLSSRWLWGDPGHSRVFSQETCAFLDQAQYAVQVGRTQMSDYRHVYRADFDLICGEEHGESWYFILKAIKPARIGG